MTRDYLLQRKISCPYTNPKDFNGQVKLMTNLADKKRMGVRGKGGVCLIFLLCCFMEFKMITSAETLEW